MSFINYMVGGRRKKVPPQGTGSNVANLYKYILEAYRTGRLTLEELELLDNWIGGRDTWPVADDLNCKWRGRDCRSEAAGALLKPPGFSCVAVWLAEGHGAALADAWKKYYKEGQQLRKSALLVGGCMA